MYFFMYFFNVFYTYLLHPMNIPFLFQLAEEYTAMVKWYTGYTHVSNAMSTLISPKLAVQMSHSGKDSGQRASVVNSFSKIGKLSRVVDYAFSKMPHRRGAKKTELAIHKSLSTWFKNALQNSLTALFKRNNVAVAKNGTNIFENYTQELRDDYDRYHRMEPCCEPLTTHPYDVVTIELVLRKLRILPEAQRIAAEERRRTAAANAPPVTPRGPKSRKRALADSTPDSPSPRRSTRSSPRFPPGTTSTPQEHLNATTPQEDLPNQSRQTTSNERHTSQSQMPTPQGKQSIVPKPLPLRKPLVNRNVGKPELSGSGKRKSNFLTSAHARAPKNKPFITKPNAKVRYHPASSDDEFSSESQSPVRRKEDVHPRKYPKTGGGGRGRF